MKTRKMSYEELAKELGMSRTSLSQKCNGHTEFKASEMRKLAEIFDESLDTLFAEDIKK